MTNTWTDEDIEAIMVQLNNQNLPFKKYEFSALGDGMSLLGTGASANVYEAVLKGKKAKEYAIKVIGFGNKHVDSESFRSSVTAQIELENLGNNIVKIYDSTELLVWIEDEHDVVKVEKIDPYKYSKPDGGKYLHLQFILMEKISPVLVSYRFHHKLFPHKLETFDEKEIMKLAYEVGMAIDHAHKRKLIHRDIKLENIFYDVKDQYYKLGDFGIARTTDDGMASTVAFTKGYGAPEVIGTLDDKYDYTADIYSFGMMLYVLMNELRFPESANYHPTVYQYMQGYVPPEPINGTDELARIVIKMLSFDPDDRYQSMEEVLYEFDKLKYGHRIKYQREHKSTALAIGTVFALMGSFVWKLSFMPEMTLDFSIWEYIFCGLCIGKSILALFNKKTGFVSTLLFGVGTYLLIAAGFTWWKLILLLFMSAFCNYWPGILGGCALVSNVTYLILKNNKLSVIEFVDYRWIAVLLLSLASGLLYLHALLGQRDEKVIKSYFGEKLFWILATGYYVFLIIMVYSLSLGQGMAVNIYEVILGHDTFEWMLSWNPGLVGICGVSFWIIWMIRERFLVFIEMWREKREREGQYY